MKDLFEGERSFTPFIFGLFLALLLGVGVTAESRQDTTLEIPVGGGKLAAQLVMPPASGRVPVVVFVTGGKEVAPAGGPNLSKPLAAEGIASLVYPTPFLTAPETSSPFEAAVVTVAATVSLLRNDTRFSTITVAGDAAGTTIAAVAARVSRADTSTTFTLEDPSAVVKAVRDLDLPGALKPRRNTGQRASLRDTTIATVDGALIAIEYGRPSKRGRVIWGNLVKWGGWWMPGADEASTFTTNRNLTFGSLTVPAGDYTLYAHPAPETFVLALNSETGQFHTVYNPNRDLGRVLMIREAMEPIAERLTFAIESRTGGGGSLRLIWDDRAYVAPFSVGSTAAASSRSNVTRSASSQPASHK